MNKGEEKLSLRSLFESIIVLTMIYLSELWSIKVTVGEKLNIFDMKCLLKVLQI